MDQFDHIRLRYPDNSKLAVKGGHEGLFIPCQLSVSDQSPLLICEGATDTAALLDMGFRQVVGRPSCTGGVKLLVDLVRKRQAKDVVIMADRDEAGQRGAVNLASELGLYVPSVRIIQPPFSVKDARIWLQNGGTQADVESAIQAASYRRLVVRYSKKGENK